MTMSSETVSCWRGSADENSFGVNASYKLTSAIGGKESREERDRELAAGEGLAGRPLLPVVL